MTAVVFRRLPGLPPYGPMASPFPPEWGRSGHEGLVVEFELPDGSTWAGNFEPGIGGLGEARTHPNGRDVLVASAGTLWQVSPTERVAEEIAPAVFAVWPVGADLIYDRQGLGFMRLGRDGVVWRTPRISWDGFAEISLEGDRLSGKAWSPIEGRWMAFSVDLEAGAVEGGSYQGSELQGRW